MQLSKSVSYIKIHPYVFLHVGVRRISEACRYPPFQLTFSLKYGRITIPLVGMAHCSEAETGKYQLIAMRALFYILFLLLLHFHIKNTKTAMPGASQLFLRYGTRGISCECIVLLRSV